MKAGEITEKQGKERMAALRKRASQSQSRSDSDISRRGGNDYRARLMKEYDKNGDGKLDEAEREAARKALSSRRNLAQKYYKDVSLWWIIAKANNLDEAHIGLTLDEQIRIPVDIEPILNKLKELSF